MIYPYLFRIVTQQTGPRHWNGILGRVFECCRQLTNYLHTDLHAGRIQPPTCIKGSLKSSDAALGFSRDDLGCLYAEYPLKLASPFEEVDAVSGGVWRASELLADEREDALLKLRFEPETTTLALHSHDHSERVIFVVGGRGTFRFLESSANGELRNVPVETGDMLIFSRGLIHTFETQAEFLELLSYHSPFIELDDPRQFRVVGNMNWSSAQKVSAVWTAAQ